MVAHQALPVTRITVVLPATDQIREGAEPRGKPDLTDERPFRRAMHQMDVAQEEQEHAAVELVHRLVADGELVAEDDLVGTIVEDAPDGGGLRRAGHGDGGGQHAAGQDVVAQQAHAEGEQQGEMKVGTRVNQPPAAWVQPPVRPDEGAQGEHGAQQRQTSEQEEGRRDPIDPEQEGKHARLRQYGPQERAGDGPDSHGTGRSVPPAPPHPAHHLGVGERRRSRRKAGDDVTDPERKQEREQRESQEAHNLGLPPPSQWG